MGAAIRGRYVHFMITDVTAIPMEHLIPAGALGPEEVTLDVRAYLVPHDSGLVLVDTGMDESGEALDAALTQAGASWSDISHVVITHGHPDHVGALGHVCRMAPDARLVAHPAEGIADTTPLSDGEVVGTLRAFATPGHTPGHLSLIDEDRGVLLIGDCVGVVGGQMVRAPEPFTADLEEAERSLHRLNDLRGARVCFAHGPELERPWEALDLLLDRS